ncbi:sensor histidine kinase [Trueperella pecoris]|uniref:GAF domain-containing protein n=1 Tax=Trueperella pecoris TaxID=2733571 RepID=A0A7M1QSA9_9ACTO|nr:GAF domain-containing protein [Trueperella pecoris]QOQ38609.1 GAF domain-containing protein [Trueperella pecoris]QOR44899.1 GAF domain-containing protein [Trueperella pecoris]QTG74808.1 GAF domain-containing protein [Trueperella pecoris]
MKASEQIAEFSRHILTIASSLDRTEVSRALVQTACELTGAQFGAVSVLDSHGDTIQFIQQGMPRGPEVIIDHPPIDHGVFNDIPLDSYLIINDVTGYAAGSALPANHPAMKNFLGVAITVNEQVWGRLYLSDKDGSFSDDDGELVRMLAKAASISVVNSLLYAESQNRARWLTASQHIVSSLMEGTDEDEALEVIAHEMRIAARADIAIIVLPSIQDTWISEIVDADDPACAHELIGLNFPKEGRARTVIREQSGVVVDSMQRLRTIRVPELRQFGPAMYTPLISHGVGLGVILLLRYPSTLEFNLHDLTMAESVAKQATLAIQLAEARHARAMAAELDERARISRDLHDLAIQQLFASGMHITAVREEMDSRGAGAEVTDSLDAAISAIDDSVKQIRQIVHSLREDGSSAALVSRLQHEASVALQSLGFAPSLLLTWNGADVVESDYHLIDDAVGSDISDDVVAVVREGLSNAARHAKASSASVKVDVDPNAILVQVIDDGSGIEQTLSRRSGLSNLAARARRHHGTFSIEPRGDGQRGTILDWRVSLR